LNPTLTVRTLDGLRWNYLTAVFTVLFQVFFSAILARLISPTDYGIMAMADIALRCFSHFAAFGIGAALVQKPTLSDEDTSTAFLFSTFLGGIFAGMVYFAAPFVLWAFPSPRIVPVLQAMGFSLLLNGLAAVPGGIILRRMDFRLLFFTSVGIYVICTLLTILLALRGFGVWSLVVGQLSQPALTALILIPYAFPKKRPTFSMESWKRLCSYGGPQSLISFFEFVTGNIDAFVVGRFFGARQIGVYNRSSLLVFLPAQYFAATICRVLFPSFSEVQKEPERLRRSFLAGITMTGVVIVPLALVMIVGAKEVILTLLGPAWIDGVPLLRIFAIAIPFGLQIQLSGVLCSAVARLGTKIALRFGLIMFLVVTLAWSAQKGVVWVAASVAVGQMLLLVAYQIVISRFLEFRIRDFLKAEIPGIYIAIPVAMVFWAAKQLSGSINVIVALLIALGVTLPVYAWLVFVRPSSMLKSLWREILSRIGAEAPSWQIFLKKLFPWYTIEQEARGVR